ncbi:hypothetical protein TNCV_1862731 [Trichonephila clavipes]|nr:hypothetical protein TNCV_1862731 [Trichonephila clavipes]
MQPGTTFGTPEPAVPGTSVPGTGDLGKQLQFQGNSDPYCKFRRSVSRSTLRRKLHECGLYFIQQPFASHSRCAIGGNFSREHVKVSTESVINGGQFFLRVSSDLALKAIGDIFLLGENLVLVFIHDTSVKEMHIDKEVSEFGEVLDTYECQHAGAIGDASVLLDDNLRPHRASHRGYLS